MLFSLFVIAKHNFWHQRTATHTEIFLFTTGTGVTHLISEAFKRLAVPGFDYTHFSQRYFIAFILVKTARYHDHISTDIATVAPALTSIQRLQQDRFAEMDSTRNIATVHTYLERMPFVHLYLALQAYAIGKSPH